MGGAVLKRVATYIVVAGGWLLAGVRTALDLVGWSTVPDDVTVAESRLDQFFVWLLSLPWWVPWGFALISTLWLMWVSWPRTLGATAIGSVPFPSEPQPVSGSASAYGYESDAHRDLSHFAMGEMFEAMRTQHELQATIIRAGADNDTVKEMAVNGIFGGLGNRKLQQVASTIYSAAGSSPVDIIQFDELQEVIKTIEREYHNYCTQSHQLVRYIKDIRDISPINLSQINMLWLEWVVSHNIMTDKYDKIKEDDRYKKLYRPFKRSQFGPLIVQTTVTDGAFPILLPPNTET